MTKKKSIAAMIVAGLALANVLFAADKTAVPANSSPRVFVLDASALNALRDGVATGKISDPALDKLRKDADKALKQQPVSVMQKPMAPPSGDKHDYLSLAPYHWPDPSKPGGLPYIRRDGEHNPEVDQVQDNKRLDEMITASYRLALAYYIFRDEKYAAQAATLLRTWFLDPATRMNPNMRYVQAIRGENEGRGAGIIDARGIPFTVDAIGLLAGSKSWSDADQKGMQDWFGKYLKWLQEDVQAKHESRAPNNHGSYYGVQVASIALFTGQKDLATKILKNETNRIASQIEKDGRQPYELVRTRALHYSTFNLIALFQLASLGQSAGVDLWNFQTKDGRSIRKAMDFLIPYVTGEKKWPYKQITEYPSSAFARLLVTASVKYQTPQYEQMAQKIDPTVSSSVECLIAKFTKK
jgi:hypothetical protein